MADFTTSRALDMGARTGSAALYSSGPALPLVSNISMRRQCKPCDRPDEATLTIRPGKRLLWQMRKHPGKWRRVVLWKKEWEKAS